MSLPHNVYTLAHPLARHKLTLLRDVETDPKLFREVVSELAVMLVYRSDTRPAAAPVEVQTPLTTAAGRPVGGDGRAGADSACRAGHGGGHVEAAAPGRGLAPGPLSGRTHAASRSSTTTSCPRTRPFNSAWCSIPCWPPAARPLPPWMCSNAGASNASSSSG